MSLAATTSCSSSTSHLFFPPKPPHTRHFRLYRRRRLKILTRLSPRSSFNTFFHDLPSLDSLNFIAPALTLASGAALYFSNRPNAGEKQDPERVSDIGEWVLFTSPTPFNRFVLLRCPSVSFEGSEFLEDVNERLVKEDTHFVRLDTGRMQLGGGGDGRRQAGSEEKLEFQRVCIAADDGGVISLDWPENLDLKKERGLDTTLLLVPGSTEGSMDSNVRSFVCDALKSGFFPIVMNPRGCAGSPLTTARLFSAADSDDISTAIQFISKARPWTTLMGVGWGYGANMLTKYLAEVGEKTPLTAATCIDNPFDLEEASRASPRRSSIDRELLSGMKDILRSNKGLFQGKTKGFDVETALRAKSVRDFEKEISMISCGFETIEDFYSESSTCGVVGNVKVPVLFIQSNDDGTVPLFSIPRYRIAQNPFTSLLLCSSTPPIITPSHRSAISWCQDLTMEWLTAVELGLLKGRHPLLEDIDVTIRPSKGLSLVDDSGRASDSSAKVNKFLDITHPNSYSIINSKNVIEGTDTSGTRTKSNQISQKVLKVKDVAVQEVDNDPPLQTGAVDAELVEEEASPVDSESMQVFETAKVVMSMLDSTMPGTLTEEKKKKVLDAVNRGETLITALQNAVPEDVRGKLTTSVSGFVQAKGAFLKFDGLLHKGSEASSGLMSRILGKDRVLPSAEGSKDQVKSPDSVEDGPPEPAGSVGKNTDELGNDPEKPADSVVDGPDSNQLDKPAGSVKKDTDDLGNNPEKPADSVVDGPDNNQLDKPDGSVGKDTDELGTKPEQSTDIVEDSPDNNQQDKPVGSVKDTGDSPGQPEETQQAVPDKQNDQDGAIAQLDVEDNDSQKTDDKIPEPPPDQTTPASVPNSPDFSVTQAFGALTGIDDSTQVAVNSVFGVIEDMITQLEDADEASEATGDDGKEKKIDSVDEKHGVINENLAEKEENEKGCSSQSDASHVADVSEGSNITNHELSKKVEEDTEVEGSELSKENVDELRHAPDTPHYITSHPDRGSLPNEQFDKVVSKMPTDSLDVDTTTALLFDYFPEEGQWKLLEQPEDMESSIAKDASSNGNKKRIQAHPPTKAGVIEPSYVVFDTDKHHPSSEYESVDKVNEEIDADVETIDFVRSIIVDSLRVEVERKLSATEIEEIESALVTDLENVAYAVSLAVGCLEDEDVALNLQKAGTLNVDCIATAISSAVEETKYLRRVLPVGVIVGSSLAALRTCFDVAPLHSDVQKEASTLEQDIKSGITNKTSTMEINQVPTNNSDTIESSGSSEGRIASGKDVVMAGAVTAALGASALLVQQQDVFGSNGTKSLREKHNTLEEAMSEKGQNNIVTSLAEKAMSVAGPVVPTKEGGEVDHDRIVAVLTDLGQRGGMLRLVGKLALLWGGIRGAISLTERLISFSHIGERPLLQRILGFGGMVIVLWSPVAIPLLPALMHCWMTNTSAKIAELACVFGLYAAVLMLVVLWGKRIRGFENPLQQYGLDMTSWAKIRDLLTGLVGGVMLVLSIQSVNSLLGYVSFVRPPSLSVSSSHSLALVKVYQQMFFLVGRGIIIATGIALAEELLFRSWLPEEIASDLGYHRGTIISGLVFALCQRSPWAIPGLWLLSFGLAGARLSGRGSLSVPIGLRSGIISSSYVLQKGGFLIYTPNFPIWLVGSPFQPFSGFVGFTFALLFALSIYPRQTMAMKKFDRTVTE